MIYFVRDAASGYVKIGFSEKPWLRFSKIQSDHPTKLDIWLVIEGDREREALLHQRFDGLRHRGEWFRVDTAIVDFVDGAIADGENVAPPVKTPPHGMTQQAICKLTGLGSGHISGILSGKATTPIWTAVHIFAASGVRVPMVAKASDADMAVLVRLFGETA